MSGRRWDIERALVASDVPPGIRHLILTMLIRADAETGVIPEDFTPSLTRLEKETGLGRSTLARYLNFAEETGWVLRKRTGTGLRTFYELAIPTSPRAGLVPERDQSRKGTSPGAGPEVVPERDGSSPGTGLVDTPESPTTSLPPTGGENAGERVTRKGRKSKPLTRLPEDWKPSEDQLLWVKAHCKYLDEDAIERATLKFKNWAIGDECEYRDWNRTFQNSMLREDGYAAERNSRRGQKAPSTQGVLNYQNPDAADAHKKGWDAE